MLTEEEVKTYLKIDASELERLVKRGKLTAYRVGGAFLRYRKEEVAAIQNGRKFRIPDQLERSWIDVVKDLSRFYGAYILITLAVVFLIIYFMQS